MISKLVVLISLSAFSLSTLAASVKVEASKEEHLISAANVDYVEYVKGQDKDVKLFSMSGGDPVVNGSHLNLAIFSDVQTGWNVYELANVRDFKLLPSSKKGYLKISLIKDTFDQNDNIVKEKSILYINLTNSDSGSIEIEEVIK